MKNILYIPEQKTPYLYLPPHTITWKQDLSHLKKTFSGEDLEIFLKIYSSTKNNPKKAKKKVESFRKKHPDHPETLNLLTYLYLSCRKIRKANILIEENYIKNPDYLFAKINFADLCLRRKQPKKVPDIFNKKFNLYDLYPDKKTFHISEFRGFMVLMGFYHLAIERKETAKEYYYLAARIDPNNSSVKILKKKLNYIPFYKKFNLRLFGL